MGKTFTLAALATLIALPLIAGGAAISSGRTMGAKQIAKQGCGGGRHAYYRRGHTRYARDSAYRPASQGYYDARGNLVRPREDYPR